MVSDAAGATILRGAIGRTVAGLDAVVADAAGRARRHQRRDDRARRHRLRPLRLLRLRARHADDRPARRRRPALHRLPHHRPVLAVAGRACSPGATTTPSACAACRNWNTGFPHMRGGITPAGGDRRRAAARPRLRHLRRRQVAPGADGGVLGRRPAHNWPLQKGFDRFYGFLQGETDQFHPELTSDNGHIDPPGRPEDGYHVSEDIVDQAIGWIGDLQSVRPDRPFFLYLAFGATARAAPGAGRRTCERWRGRFDEGYDVVRERWFERQLELGIVPRGHDAGAAQPGRAGVGRPHRQPAAPSPPGCRRRSRRCSSTPTTRSAGSSTSSRSRGCSTTRCSWSSPTTAPPARAARTA